MGIKEETYTKDQVYNILKNFNNLYLKVRTFVSQFSTRIGHIEIRNNKGIVTIYLNAHTDYAIIKEMFLQINENNWIIEGIDIEFENEIAISIGMEVI
jgi:type II secretory pathway component GspD/PulD (secretin)